MHVLARLVFVALMALHVALWPSPLTIFVASVYGILGFLQFASLRARANSNAKEEFLTPGVFIMQTTSTIWYTLTVMLAFYFAAFFVAYIMHELQIQDIDTVWIYPTPAFLGSYSFTSTGNNAFEGSVTDKESIEMRENPFVWKRAFDFAAPLVIGSIATAGLASAPLACGDPAATGHAAWACYAPKLLLQKTPTSLNGAYAARPFVPLSSDFYDIDVRVTPPVGTTCANLEVYRVNLDTDGGVAHPLDYPGSTSTHGSGANYSTTGIFGQAGWGLGVQHSFTDSQYKAKVAAKCDADGQALVVRLPRRNEDVDSNTARVALDVLVVTAGAKVDVHATWNANDNLYTGVFSLLKQIVTTDGLQDWRISSEANTIGLRFAIAIAPLLICWYYVIALFEDNACANPVIFVSMTVLLPAALIFLMVGAWIPTIGCVLGVVALNYRVDSSSWREGSKMMPFSEMQRQFFLFIMALCNSIHFVWVVVLISQAGYSAFLYDMSLHQIYDMTQSFIVSTGISPTLVAILLPSILALLLAMLVTTAICIVLEVMAHRNGGLQATAANAANTAYRNWFKSPF